MSEMTEKEMQSYRVQGLSCTNCAATFEKNVKELPGVEDAIVNFGASKIVVKGNTTIEELEKAGAFENLLIRVNFIIALFKNTETYRISKLYF